MTTSMLELKCRDPIVSRDGRPFGFGQGSRMRVVGWPLPSVVAGSLRTAIGKAAGRDFSEATALELLQVSVAGVLPVADTQLYLPAPNDCVVLPEGKRPLRATPEFIERGGGDWPEGLWPVTLPFDKFPNEFKPGDLPAWWPADQYANWLTGKDLAFDHRFLLHPQVEERSHVHMDGRTGAGIDGELFTTAALPLTHLQRHAASGKASFEDRYADLSLSVRVDAADWCRTMVAGLDTLHPLGGERRLVHWKATSANGWTCPEIVADALAETNRVRMVLATPAIFRGGWKPGWLNEQLTGTPPGSNVSLKLVGVSISRWRAVSGWSLAKFPNQPRGPKPVKRVVPTGGVYFFEVGPGEAADLKARWLEPVSDDEQDRRDGFGLAAWGIW